LASITYNYTITDAMWRDCRPVYANMLKLRDEINGQLDEANLDATDSFTWARLIVSGGWRTPLVQPGASFVVAPAAGKYFEFQDTSYDTVMKVSTSGVQFG